MVDFIYYFWWNGCGSMYLLYGIERYLIDEEIKKISNNINELNISKYNLEETSLKDIIEDACTISLFNEKKLIIVENAYIFTGTINKKLPSQDTKLLEDYFNHINPDSDIIFIVEKDKIDTRKKITSLMKEKGKIIELNKISNLNNFVTEKFKPYKINNNVIKIFLDRVGSHLDIITNEIEKIKIYKGNDLEVTETDINNLTIKNVDMDIFKLIDNILIRNKEQAIECLEEMMKYGEEPLAIIIMLANQFRIMYQAKLLVKKGYSEKDIASSLEIHEFRIKKALEKARIYNEEIILKNLEKLADLDYNIKSGNIDKNIGLELFLLNL